jgi:hypothetical protein
MLLQRFFSRCINEKIAIAQKRQHNEVFLTLKGYLETCASDCIACTEQVITRG